MQRASAQALSRRDGGKSALTGGTTGSGKLDIRQLLAGIEIGVDQGGVGGASCVGRMSQPPY